MGWELRNPNAKLRNDTVSRTRVLLAFAGKHSYIGSLFSLSKKPHKILSVKESNHRVSLSLYKSKVGFTSSFFFILPYSLSLNCPPILDFALFVCSDAFRLPEILRVFFCIKSLFLVEFSRRGFTGCVSWCSGLVGLA